MKQIPVLLKWLKVRIKIFKTAWFYISVLRSVNMDGASFKVVTYEQSKNVLDLHFPSENGTSRKREQTEDEELQNPPKKKKMLNAK